MTQAEIAAEFGISQMHVSRILRKVLDQLRDGADGRGARTSGTAPERAARPRRGCARARCTTPRTYRAAPEAGRMEA